METQTAASTDRGNKRRTFSLASVKSALFTRIRRSRSASKPASVHTALMSAPERSSFIVMNSSRSTSVPKLMRAVCSLRCPKIRFSAETGTIRIKTHLKMCRLVLMSGNGNSILRSIRPGRMRAGSSDSILFVAMMTFTSPRESKPSSWLRSSNIVRWISRSPPDVESYLRTKPYSANSTGS